MKKGKFEMKIKKFAAIPSSSFWPSPSASGVCGHGTDATITIQNINGNITIVGKTFSAYRLFDLDYAPGRMNIRSIRVSQHFTAKLARPSSDTSSALLYK
jgi:hypothetical protein